LSDHRPDEDVTAQDGQWLLTGVVVGEDGPASGAVVYARSLDPVEDCVHAMWGWLAVTGIGALVLAAVLSVRLARWVSRPLAGLGEAAARLGAGDLSERADPVAGPMQCAGSPRPSTGCLSASRPSCTATVLGSRTSRTRCARR
jgi:methyl-accepting chemotaxis protein